MVKVTHFFLRDKCSFGLKIGQWNEAGLCVRTELFHAVWMLTAVY